MLHSWRQLFVIGFVVSSFWGVAKVHAQLASFDVVPADATPTVGEPVEIRIRALSILGLSIPLFLPLNDIGVEFDQAGVSLESVSNGFLFSDEGNGSYLIDADGLHVFDALGGITLTVNRELAGAVDLEVTSGLVSGLASLVWQVADSHHLAFLQQPVDGLVTEPIEVAVELVDEFGNRVQDDPRTITLVVLGNADLLVGVTSKVTQAGVATWGEADDLLIGEAGSDFRLMAIATGGDLIETGLELSAAFARSALTNGNMNDNSTNNNDNENVNGNGNDNSSVPGDNENSNSGNTNQNDNSVSNGNDNENGNDNTTSDNSNGNTSGNTNANDNGGEEDQDDDGLDDSMDSEPNNPDRDSDGLKDGVDNCPDHANADQLDDDTDGVGNFCEDDDRDGVINGLEDRGPNGGDANNDGIPDRTQPHVAIVMIDETHVITLVCPASCRLADVAPLESISPADQPAVLFPLGFLKFSVLDLPAKGASITVQGIMNVSATSVVNSFYAFGPTPDNQTPHWHEFDFDGTTGVSVTGDVITMQFIDGGRGDDDGKSDGRLSVRGGPAQVIDVPPMGCGAGCGAGMTLAFFPCLLATRVRRFWFRRIPEKTS